MSDELDELKEHAEHAKHDPSLIPATLTMTVLAVLVAISSLLGHRTAIEESVLQNKVTDQWAYYQAKNVRRHTDELFADLMTVLNSKEAEAERYRDEQKELDSKARELEQETILAHRKADRFDLGEVFLEIALVITSI